MQIRKVGDTYRDYFTLHDLDGDLASGESANFKYKLFRNNVLETSEVAVFTECPSDPPDYTGGAYEVKIVNLQHNENYFLYYWHPSFQPSGWADIIIVYEKDVTDLITHLLDIKGTGFVKDTDSLKNLSHKAGTKGTDNIFDKVSPINWDDITFLKAIEGGDWEVVNNQMIFYNASHVEVVRFNLYDSSGQPAMERVYKRLIV